MGGTGHDDHAISAQQTRCGAGVVRSCVGVPNPRNVAAVAPRSAEMGAAASVHGATRISREEARSALGPFFDAATFDSIQDAGGFVLLSALQHAYSDRTDVFLTHDWGHELGVENHKRVKRVNALLQERGLRTWFDEDKMEGNVKQKMVEGIEKASCIVVFVTRRYMEKVGGTNQEDNCFLEFNYAARRKTAARMIPVVMEERMKNPAEWTGILGMVLGGTLYVDMSSDALVKERVEELYARVVSTNSSTLRDTWESPEWGTLLASKQPVTSLGDNPVLKAATDAAALADSDHALLAALSDWFVSSIHAVRATADRYALALLQAGIGSISKLRKKLSKDPALLGQLVCFDEDDVDDIIAQLASYAPPTGGPIAPAPIVDSPNAEAKATSNPSTASGADAGESGGESTAADFVHDGSADQLALSSFDRSELLELKTLGFSVQQFLGKGLSPMQVHVLFPDYPLAEFLLPPSPCQLPALLLAGFTVDEITRCLRLDPAQTVMSMVEYGLSPHQLRAVYSAADFRGAGCSASFLLEAGFELGELRGAGYGGAELRGAGVESAQLLELGFTRAEVFSVEEMRDKGLTLLQLKNNVGFGAAQLRGAGFLETELLEVGFTVADLKAAGCFLPREVGCSRAINTGGEVGCVCMLADGMRVLSGGGEDRSLRLWEMTKGKCLRIFVGHTSAVTCIVDAQDGVRVASASADRSVRVWDVNTGKILQVLDKHLRGVTCCAIVDRTKGLLVSGCMDGALKIWDYLQGNVLRSLVGHTESIHSVCALPDGAVVSGGNDKTVRVWSCHTGQCNRVIDDKASRGITCVFGLGSEVVCSGGKDGGIRIWNLATGALSRTLAGHKNGVCAIAAFNDEWLLSVGRDNSVTIWSQASGDCVHSLPGHGDFVQSIAVHPGGLLFATGSKDKFVKIWR